MDEPGQGYFTFASVMLTLVGGVVTSVIANQRARTLGVIVAGMVAAVVFAVGIGVATNWGHEREAQIAAMALIAVGFAYWLGRRSGVRSDYAHQRRTSNEVVLPTPLTAAPSAVRSPGDGARARAMAEEVEDAKERESHGSTSTGTGDLAGELSKSKETIQQLAAQLLRAQTAKHDAEMNAAGLEEEVRRLRDANERIGEIAKRLEARSANVSEAIRAQNVAEAETARLKKELAILKAKNDESAALIELFESRRVEAERTASDRRARVLASFVRHLKEAAEYVHEGKRPRRPFREWCAEVESEVEQHLSGAGVSWLQEVFLATRNAARRFAAQSNETDDEEYLRYQYVLNNLKSDLEQTGEACFRV